MKYNNEIRFQIGDFVALSKEYGGPLHDKFKGQIIGYSKGLPDINGTPCVKIKRLDLASGSIQTWGQGWLEKVDDG